MSANPQRLQIPIDVVGSSTFGRYPEISVARTYNMFISDEWLVNYFGWKKRLNLTSETLSRSQGRGLFRSIRGNIIVAVVDSEVYRLDTMVGAIQVGSIATSSGPVFMDENLNGQICIVDGLNAYIYNRFNNALTPQDFMGAIIPNYVCYHDTHFLLGNGDISGNGAKWVVADYATDNTISITTELAFQGKPDYAKAIRRIPGKGNNVLVIGTSSAEIHTAVPNRQVYQRVSTISIDYGTTNVATFDSSDRFLAWIAINENNAPTLMVFDGAEAKSISTDGINYLLSAIKFPEDAIGFFFRMDGHLFYQFTFYNDADNISLTYDFNTGKFFHVSDYGETYHPARQIIYADKKSYFISLKNGSIYECGTDFVTYDDNIVNASNAAYKDYYDRIIPRYRVPSNIPFPKPSILTHFSVEIEQGEDASNQELSAIYAGTEFIYTIQEGEQIYTLDGQPLTTIPTRELELYKPRIDFSYSWDGGETFSMEVSRYANYTAKRRNITEWYRMGMANDFTPKIKFWGKSRFVVGKGELEIMQ